MNGAPVSGRLRPDPGRRLRTWAASTNRGSPSPNRDALVHSADRDDFQRPTEAFGTDLSRPADDDERPAGLPQGLIDAGMHARRRPEAILGVARRRRRRSRLRVAGSG